jgi:pyruvate dehydrogenase E2 component (dihydrolipoamide acetyltransferase)
MRKAIAAAMARSKREIPHYYLTQTVDLRRALTWLEDANRERPPTERLLPAVLFLKATALALRKVPELNGFWQKDNSCPPPAFTLAGRLRCGAVA